MSDNPNEAIDAEIEEMEALADAEAEASREERGVSKEDDAAALAEEVGAETSEDEVDAEVEPEQPTPPAAVGSNRTSRQRRQDRQRGR
jgi:hypothetical protein